MDFKPTINCNVQLPETPTWDSRIEKLYWTDLGSGDIHRYDPKTGADEVWHTGQSIGSAIPCDDLNRLLCVLRDGVYLLDLPTGALTLIADPSNGDPSVRYSDSRVDAVGRIYVSTVALSYGSKNYTSDQTGGFYCIERDGTVKVIDPVINQYNTVIWNRDSSKMYVADTFNECLLSYDYDLAVGVISKGKKVLNFQGSCGMPDGMSMDVEDNLYICHWTGQISVWDRDLNEKEHIPFPTPQVTCGGFGGKDMHDFYVGSGSWNYSQNDKKKNPGCGGFFKAHSAIAGMPYHIYRTK